MRGQRLLTGHLRLCAAVPFAMIWRKTIRWFSWRLRDAFQKQNTGRTSTVKTWTKVQMAVRPRLAFPVASSAHVDGVSTPQSKVTRRPPSHSIFLMASIYRICRCHRDVTMTAIINCWQAGFWKSISEPHQKTRISCTIRNRLQARLRP